MYRVYNAIFAFFLLCWIPLGLAATVRLHCLPGVPVQHVSQLSIEISDPLPMLNTALHSKQLLKFETVVLGNGDNALLTELPATLSCKLTDVAVELHANQEKWNFDLSTEQAPFHLKQLSHLLDRSVQLHIPSLGAVTDDHRDLADLDKEFPVLKELPLKAFLNDLIRHPITLLGIELRVGSVVQYPIRSGVSLSFFDVLTYEVIDITEQEVIAVIRGVVKPTPILLQACIKPDGENKERVMMVISGMLQGQISWKRSNAQIYTLDTEYICTSQFKVGSKQWGMHMTMSQHTTSAVL